MRAATIKIPYARRGGVLVHVSEVEAGRQPDCFCVECGSPLIAKRGPIKIHHFAHDRGSTCSPESALHRLGKEILADRLQQAIASGSQLPIKWRCDTCYDTHIADLARDVRQVVVEYASGPIRADIGLLDQSGTFLWAVEMVVTHAPDADAVSYYRERRVPVVQIHLKNGEDLEPLCSSQTLLPQQVIWCARPKCACGGYLVERRLHVVTGDCWKCHQPMSISFISADSEMHGPDEFTAEERLKAAELGAIIEERFSKTTRTRYLANICRRCKAFSGSFYLHDYWHLADKSDAVVVLRECSECGKQFPVAVAPSAQPEQLD